MFDRHDPSHYTKLTLSQLHERVRTSECLKNLYISGSSLRCFVDIYIAKRVLNNLTDKEGRRYGYESFKQLKPKEAEICFGERYHQLVSDDFIDIYQFSLAAIHTAIFTTPAISIVCNETDRALLAEVKADALAYFNVRARQLYYFLLHFPYRERHLNVGDLFTVSPATLEQVLGTETYNKRLIKDSSPKKRNQVSHTVPESASKRSCPENVAQNHTPEELTFEAVSSLLLDTPEKPPGNLANHSATFFAVTKPVFPSSLTETLPALPRNE